MLKETIDNVEYEKTETVDNNDSSNKNDKTTQVKLNKSKNKSHVSSQIEQERQEAIKKVFIPLGVLALIFILYLLGFYGFLTMAVLFGSICFAIYDYHAVKVSKTLSYALTSIYMVMVFFTLKSYFPDFENPKIGALVYYLLDLSLLTISFIVSFFILKGLDILSIHKNRNLRPISGILKSSLAISSIILLVSFTSLTERGFLQKEFENSRFTNLIGKFIPDYKPGKKTSLVFGKYGIKIGK